MAKLNNSTPAAIVCGFLLFGWLFYCAARLFTVFAYGWTTTNERQSGMFTIGQAVKMGADIGLFFTVAATFFFYFKKNVIDES